MALILVVYAVRPARAAHADVLLLVLSGLALASYRDRKSSTASSPPSPSKRATAGGSSASPSCHLHLFIIQAAGAHGGCAQLAPALGGTRGARLGRVRQAACPPLQGQIAILVPAYNEAENIGHVLDLMPAEVCGVRTEVLVVDDGSRDGTGDVAAEHGASSPATSPTAAAARRSVPGTG